MESQEEEVSGQQDLHIQQKGESYGKECGGRKHLHHRPAEVVLGTRVVIGLSFIEHVQYFFFLTHRFVGMTPKRRSGF